MIVVESGVSQLSASSPLSKLTSLRYPHSQVVVPSPCGPLVQSPWISLLCVKNMCPTRIACALVGSHADQSARRAVVITPPRLGVAAPGAVSFRNGIGPADGPSAGAAARCAAAVAC